MAWDGRSWGRPCSDTQGCLGRMGGQAGLLGLSEERVGKGLCVRGRVFPLLAQKRDPWITAKTLVSSPLGAKSAPAPSPPALPPHRPYGAVGQGDLPWGRGCQGGWGGHGTPSRGAHALVTSITVRRGSLLA